MKLYRYLFYQIYRLTRKKKREKDIAHINAVFILTFIVFLNIMDIDLIISVLIDNKIFESLKFLKNDTRIYFIIFCVILFVFNYYYFVFKEKFRIVINEFKDISKTKKIVYSVLVWLYFIVVFAICPYIIFNIPPPIIK